MTLLGSMSVPGHLNARDGLETGVLATRQGHVTEVSLSDNPVKTVSTQYQVQCARLQPWVTLQPLAAGCGKEMDCSGADGACAGSCLPPVPA